jgi:alkylated DNA repair dioxygenase AlkB
MTAERLRAGPAPIPARAPRLGRAKATLPELVVQRSLFSRRGFDSRFPTCERVDLGQGAWLDVQQEWVSDHQALFESLYESTDWQSHSRNMYDRSVAVPRLTGVPPSGGFAARVVREMSEALSRRYGRPLGNVSLACYRDGRDSVAPHGDTLGTDVDDAIVAVVSLGAPRRFSLRRVERGSHTGRWREPPERFWTSPDSLALAVGQGDLVVMGGTCQRTWLHGIPKVARAAPRIAVMFR